MMYIYILLEIYINLGICIPFELFNGKIYYNL